MEIDSWPMTMSPGHDKIILIQRKCVQLIMKVEQ